MNSPSLLRNYWTDYWEPGMHFPRFCFISNDKRPDGAERERIYATGTIRVLYHE